MPMGHRPGCRQDLLGADARVAAEGAGQEHRREGEAGVRERAVRSGLDQVKRVVSRGDGGDTEQAIRPARDVAGGEQRGLAALGVPDDRVPAGDLLAEQLTGGADDVKHSVGLGRAEHVRVPAFSDSQALVVGHGHCPALVEEVPEQRLHVLVHRMRVASLPVARRRAHAGDAHGPVRPGDQRVTVWGPGRLVGQDDQARDRDRGALRVLG